jgi:hypothetical protein
MGKDHNGISDYQRTRNSVAEGWGIQYGNAISKAMRKTKK